MPVLDIASFPTLSGLCLSGTDEFGVDWITEPSLKGWGSPSGSLAPVARPRGPGSWAGDSFLQSRSLVIEGRAIAPTQDVALDASDRVIAATTLSDTLLSFTEGSRVRHMTVRRDGEVLITWVSELEFAWSIQLFAADGRKFGIPESSFTSLPSSSGGLTIPFSVPFSINAVTNSGQISLFNAGNTTGPVALRISGPCNGPVVTHVGSGAAEVWSSSWSGGAGEFLDVDMEKRTVLANGQSSRNSTITSRQWFEFDPGWNTFSFTAATFSAGSLLFVSATPAWE